MSQILDNSIAISLIKSIFEQYRYNEKILKNIYSKSLTYRLINKFRENVKICLKYSILGRISQKKKTTFLVLESSQTARYLINFLTRWKDKATRYLVTSLAVILAKDTKEQLNLSPVRVISIIVVIAITVNVILSFFLHKQIGLWGWLIRALFLFVAVSGLFSKADWSTVKRNSVFFKKM